MRRYNSLKSLCRQVIEPQILCLGKMSNEKKNGEKLVEYKEN
jgi:hypothetical protein